MTTRGSPSIYVKVYADAHPNHLAYLYAGLCDLAYSGKIRLDFAFPWSKMAKRPAYGDVTLHVSVMHLERKKEVTLVFDMHDKSDKFIYQRLEQCDIYFKRSYYQPDIDRLDVRWRKKVLPFGLCFPCRSSHEKAIFRRALGNLVARPGKSIRSFLLNTVDILYLIRQWYQSPGSRDFAQLFSNKKRAIIFQTQVYAPSETSDEVRSLNDFRVETIRMLKRRFGDQFHGGLLPSPYARTNYPDCIAVSNTKRMQYIRMLKASAVGVYTRGLHHSTAWKMGEYLAAGMCVVGEPPRNQLPRPLVPGKNYLPCTTPEECVTACEKLMQDDNLLEEMSRANWEYWLTEVEPSNKMWSCLNIGLQATQKVRGLELTRSKE
jgi:hypothetical protein